MQATNCGNYSAEAGNYSEAIGEMAVRDAALCPFFDSMGAPVFATLLLLGLVFVPMYIRQDSAVTPMIVVFIIGGVLLGTMGGMGQSLLILAVVIGIPAIATWFLIQIKG